MKSRRESGGKTIEIAENWLQRFRMEGEAKKHLMLFSPPFRQEKSTYT